ncbi:MAG: dephospho-CoA kinase [Firmicutes bacterium]|nr:dephospho-CoA kinase [Bacillota bacterium]
MTTVIGLTGRIGSGKSLAAADLKEMGAAIIDADKVGHQIIAKGKPAYDQIIDAIPGDYLDETGEIDRKKLAAAVFGDASGAYVRKLNAITHPQITAEIQQKIEEYTSQGYPMIVIEAALLLQSDLMRLVDGVWLITAPDEIAVARAAARDGVSREKIEARLAAQMSEEEMAAQADLRIVNDGDRAQLAARLARAMRDWLGDNSGI